MVSGEWYEVSLNNTRDELTVRLERAVLVSVALPKRPWQGDDPFDELRGLVTTAGAVIVGHSERRTDHHETDEMVRAKALAVWRAKLVAIVCIGETRAEREAGREPSRLPGPRRWPRRSRPAATPGGWSGRRGCGWRASPRRRTAAWCRR